MKKQILQELRFTISQQYENYEFDLDCKGEKTINNITYEVYHYINDDFDKLFGIPISKGIFLLFNADILSAVYFSFAGNHYDYLLNKINSYLPQN